MMTNLTCGIEDVECLIGKDTATLYNTWEAMTPWQDPNCRDACQISPAVDGKVIIDMIGAMGFTARKVPTMAGWCKDDGASMIEYDLYTPGLTMTETEYQQWWARFRGTGFDNER